MKIKVYYRRNLKLSPAKLAAAVGHVTKELGYKWSELGEYPTPEDDIIIVLKASDSKFQEIMSDITIQEGIVSHLHVDKGLSEVDPNTEIAFGWVVL